MPRRTNPAHQDRPGFDLRTSRQTTLRGDHHPFTDIAVVGDLDLIVDFCPLANPCIGERASIHGGQSPDISYHYTKDALGVVFPRGR